MRHRILSMDGTSISGGEGYVTVGMLRGLRRMLASRSDSRTLLDQVDLFVGNSAGAVNAALFASEENPDDALDKAIEFWGEIASMTRKGLSITRVVRALTGSSSLLDSTHMRQLVSRYFGDKRLRDLPKKVAIPAFQLDGLRKGVRSWKAKIFHNTGREDDPDMNELVVDVLMRSGSPPLIYPIYQSITGQGSGYVDGALYANNPALVGLAQVIHNLSQHSGEQVSEARNEPEPAGLAGILLLSMGNGIKSAYVSPNFQDGIADWGFSKWLATLNPPMLLVRMVLEAGEDAVDYQCRMILRSTYCRLNPAVGKRLVAFSPQQVESALEQVLGMPSTQETLESALQWLSRSGWLEPRSRAHPLR